MQGIDYEITKKIISMLHQAGSIAQRYFKSHNLKIYIKGDGSPVTNADKEISDFIIDEMKQILPKAYIVSEEQEDKNLNGKDTFWLLDPIDGTSNYIQGINNYTILFCLVINFKPSIGFIYYPATQELYYNTKDGKVLFVKDSIEKEITPPQNFTLPIKVLVDEPFTEKLEDKKFTKIYALKYADKIQMILDSKVDLYYIYKNIMEWDIAAAHAILMSLGGNVFDFDGEELTYGKFEFKNPELVVCNCYTVKDIKTLIKYT